MRSLHREPASVYSHPYRPELALLRVVLAAEGYHPSAVAAIVTYAAHEGTTCGTPGLDPVNAEAAEHALETGCEAEPLTSPAWDEHGYWTGYGPRYRSTGAAWIADVWACLTTAFGRFLRQAVRAHAGPVADDGMGWPREHTDAERREFEREVAEHFRLHPEG